MGWGDPNEIEIGGNIRDALREGDYETLRQLFTDHPDWLRHSRGTDYWLDLVASRGDLPAVKLLVELGIGVNEPNDLELPEGPIYMAAANGRTEVVKWLLDHGAEIHHVFRGIRRGLPLLAAARNGHFDIVKLLIEHGAEINLPWHGTNAYMNAKAYGNPEIAAYLRALGGQDLRETTLPDYQQAHQAILAAVYREAEQPTCRKLLDIAGDPPIVVYVAPPSQEAPWQALFTVGVSDRCLPSEIDELAAMELRMVLPPDWPLDATSLADPTWNWPIEQLKKIAAEIRDSTRLPDRPILFLNGDPPQPLTATTELCGWACMVREGWAIQTADYRWIDFYDLNAIYAEEAELIRQSGDEAFAAQMYERGLPIYLTPDRANVALPAEEELVQPLEDEEDLVQPLSDEDLPFTDEESMNQHIDNLVNDLMDKHFPEDEGKQE